MSSQGRPLTLLRIKYPFPFRVCCAAILLALVSAWVPGIVALAGDCDGTAGNDVVNCTSDPTVPDDVAGLGLGDDTYTQDSGILADSVLGDSLEDGSFNTGNGGNDEITIQGDVFETTGDTTDGNGGDDQITISATGSSIVVAGDDVTGDGGDDTIVVNGLVFGVEGDGADGNGGNDTIIINGIVDFVAGDEVDGNGGDDLIVINGQVLSDVTGDCANLDGGDDTIIVNGYVAGDVIGDCAGGAGGDDTVTLGGGSQIDGLIDGEDGTDILQFAFLTQDQLDGYSASGGSLTYNGVTYTWANFEQLIGLLEELGIRFIYRHNGIAAISTEDGIKVINENGLVAFIPYNGLSAMNAGAASMHFQSTAHSIGWYVGVVKLGRNPASSTHTLYQVTIYNAAGVLQGQFTFSQ